ncbi:MAG: M67 family metallopeptidase [bacterium]
MIKQEILTLPESIYKDIKSHAFSLAPIESCGYLGAKDYEVTSFYPMTNVDNSDEHFSFDPKEQFAVMKQARAKGEKLLGVYHSHPASPARLSAEDVHLFNDPESIYLIMSLLNDQPELKAFRVKKPSEQEVHVSEVVLDIKKGG